AAGLIVIDHGAAGAAGDGLAADFASASGGRWDARAASAGGGDALMQRLCAATQKLAMPVLILRDGPGANGASAPATALASVADAEIVVMDSAAPAPTASLAMDRADALNALLLDFLERRCPLAPPEYREGSDARTFRDALGCFATGVTIVTAMDADGAPIGLTANSFTSVSLDPPLLLVCIARNAGSAAVLERAERFAVNVLQIGQQPTSNRFAGKGEDRFAATPWQIGEFGTPVLSGSLASFECARDAVHPGGDHFLLVGRVLKAMFEPRRDPLLYFRGKYRRLHFA
ncbi:MAG: flavin reductase family protein, partial [Sphingopyxis sp.]